MKHHQQSRWCFTLKGIEPQNRSEHREGFKVLKIIREEDVGESFSVPSVYKERVASRAVVFYGAGNVALIHSAKEGNYKLPGGGVEDGENMQTGFAREVAEEIGCSINDVQELGIVEEYRNKSEQHQVSYCFLANLDGEKGTPNLTDVEEARGFEPVWMNLEEAIKTLESTLDVGNYWAKFMTLRDLEFLKEAHEVQVVSTYGSPA